MTLIPHVRNLIIKIKLLLLYEIRTHLPITEFAEVWDKSFHLPFTYSEP